MTLPTEPGDYCGPVVGYTGDKPAVFFLKPHARDPGTPPGGRNVHHVTSPPHTFTEEADGTLTISASIGDTFTYTRPDGEVVSSPSDGWHGYLEHGVWRTV
jgi:hypothetical protein